MDERSAPGATHTMSLKHAFPSGAEEWQCSTCGRSFIVQWPPNFKKIILEPGDESVPHAGGSGGIRIAGLQPGAADADEDSTVPGRSAPQGDQDDDTPFDDSSLGPWLKWFEDNGLKDSEA